MSYNRSSDFEQVFCPPAPRLRPVPLPHHETAVAFESPLVSAGTSIGCGLYIPSESATCLNAELSRSMRVSTFSPSRAATAPATTVDTTRIFLNVPASGLLKVPSSNGKFVAVSDILCALQQAFSEEEAISSKHARVCLTARAPDYIDVEILN